MKRVFIVAEGQWGSVRPEEYRGEIRLYQRILSEAEDSGGNKAALVTIIDTIQGAERKLKEEGADVVVFISRGVEKDAERIAKENPRTRVVVFTGLIPEGKVVWVSKAHAADRKAIQNIVLHY